MRKYYAENTSYCQFLHCLRQLDDDIMCVTYYVKEFANKDVYLQFCKTDHTGIYNLSVFSKPLGVRSSASNSRALFSVDVHDRHFKDVLFNQNIKTLFHFILYLQNVISRGAELRACFEDLKFYDTAKQ